MSVLIAEIHRSGGRDASMGSFLLQWRIQLSLVVMPWWWWWNAGGGIAGWTHNKDSFCMCVEVRERVARDGSRRREEGEI